MTKSDIQSILVLFFSCLFGLSIAKISNVIESWEIVIILSILIPLILYVVVLLIGILTGD